MHTLTQDERDEELMALRRERARQDVAMAAARGRLDAMGRASLVVPRAALEAIDAACLVRVSTLTSAAIRG